MADMSKRRIRIDGIVTEDVIHNEDESHYKVKSAGEEYAITSIGRQAAKDNLFIRKGQHMIIEGKETTEKRNVISEKSRIFLEREIVVNNTW